METMEGGSGVGVAEGGAGGGIAMEFPAGESSGRVPRRIRRRLMESKASGPSSVEEIEAKLREAELRRQQFHEWLSSKAKPKPRSPSWSSQEEDLGQRLEAKLYAAEQKRLSLLAKAQMRLARLDKLRQAAKTGVEKRFETEREKLGTKVESRVQQAEENRMRLLKAHMQRQAAAQERKARSILQRITRENKYKECVRSAILQKRAAAEKKRLGFLEAEKSRVHARVMQVHSVAKSVCHQRESERRRLKEQLENRLQRARRQRAEYLRQRGSSQSLPCINVSKHGEFLSRKLARCWRRFVKSRKTTFTLAKAYDALQLNESTLKAMPFEQLALRIESASALQTVKLLLDRLECRFLLSRTSSSCPENIDHLLKRLASPNRKGASGKATRTRVPAKQVVSRESRSTLASSLSRYPVRVVLCAYMILGHPRAVFSEQGDREYALMDSAAKFVREFELLIKVILDGPNKSLSSRKSSPDNMSDDIDNPQDTSFHLASQLNFRNQLAAFDAAWRSYLYCFVVWKVKDARSLEDDLIRAACQLELSMIQTCKLTSEGETCELSHDMRAIQMQVTKDQHLLREKVRHLSGNAGIERMECALTDTRSKYFEAKGNGSPPAAHIPHISSPASLTTTSQSVPEQSSLKSRPVARSLFDDNSVTPKAAADTPSLDAGLSLPPRKQSPTDNAVLVNEIIHGSCGGFEGYDRDELSIRAKVKETMEKAFWDGTMEALNKEEPDYGRIVSLVKEVRDELCEMSPQSWKQEILESIDLEILSQVLESGVQDTDYLGRILEYALRMLQKLSAPAAEDEMKKTHKELLSELAAIPRSGGESNSSFIIATVKGLRFVLDEIQVLKKEISKARILMMEPIIKGSAGLEYLQKAFSDRYGPPDTANALPLTVQWITSVKSNLEEWEEHSDSISALLTTNEAALVTTLRTGGSIPLVSKEGMSKSQPSVADATGAAGEQPDCNGDRIDVMLRLGLLKLVSRIQGLDLDTLPETLELNFKRLRSVQSQLQKIIVIATSMLVLRQVLVSEKAVSSSDLENMISNSVKRLSELLDNAADAGIEEIIDSIVGSPTEDPKIQRRREMMAGMLMKSLQNNDPVFTKVSKSIYLAARGLVFGGTGMQGRRLADAVLRRVGAASLLDRLLKAAEVLIVVALVSCRVHGPWYRSMV
ncbi:putative T-complex 11 protein [Dioscorea sansibarensis]